MTGEATADTATTTETTVVATETTDATDYKAEAEKWQALARKHEDRAKANSGAAKELEEFKRQGMTEIEAAIDKAKSDTRAEVAAQFGSLLVNAEVRAAATGRVADVDALLEGVDGSKFLDVNGEPDRDAINKWIDRIAPAGEEQETQQSTSAFFDLGQGVRTDQTALNGDPLLAGIQAKLGIR